MAGMAEVQRRQGGRPFALTARAFPPPPPPPPIDREKTCPLLLRVFTKIGDHHSNEDFAVRGKEPKDDVQIYTWKDATLRELTDLVKEVTPAGRRRDARLSFAFVYPDKNGRFVVREVGKSNSHRNGKLDDNKALTQLGFQIGGLLGCGNFLEALLCQIEKGMDRQWTNNHRMQRASTFLVGQDGM